MNFEDLSNATPQQITDYHTNIIEAWASKKYPYTIFCHDWRYVTKSVYVNMHTFRDNHVLVSRVEILDDRYAQIWSVSKETVDRNINSRILVLSDQPNNLTQFPKALRTKGVYVNGKNKETFGARIYVKGEVIYLGTFKTYAEAQNSYIVALKAYRPDQYSKLVAEFKLPEDKK